MKKIRNFLYKIYRFSWKIIRPQTIGVRAILHKNNKILLVKHTYSEQWFLPGGGLKKGETLERAINRELLEELGVTVEHYLLHGVFNNFFEGKRDYIIVFSSDNFKISPKKDSEIEEYNFFNPHQLPEKTSLGTKKRITEFIEHKSSNFGNWS